MAEDEGETEKLSDESLEPNMIPDSFFTVHEEVGSKPRGFKRQYFAKRSFRGLPPLSFHFAGVISWGNCQESQSSVPLTFTNLPDLEKVTKIRKVKKTGLKETAWPATVDEELREINLDVFQDQKG